MARWHWLPEDWIRRECRSQTRDKETGSGILWGIHRFLLTPLSGSSRLQCLEEGVTGVL